MRRRLALVWTLAVVGAALALPATTVAGSGYSYRVVYNYCDGAQVRIKVKNIAQGFTDTNKLTIDSWAQRAPRKSGPWTTVYRWDRASYKFENDGQKHWLTSWRSYNGNNKAWWRVVMRLKAWNNRTQLASVDVFSVKC